MKSLLFILLFVAFLNSCDTDSPVSANEQQHIDEGWTSLLMDSTFASGYDTTTYYKDHTFVEKNYTLNDSNEKVLEYTRTGKFHVEESILFKTDSEIEVSESTEINKGNFQIVFNDVELSNDNGEIQFSRINVLKNVDGHPGNIWGTWETTKFTYKQINDSTYQGRQKYFYTFNKDSTKVHYGWENIDMDDPERHEFYSDFKYNKPHLELEGPAEYNITVSFKNDKVYWRYD